MGTRSRASEVTNGGSDVVDIVEEFARQVEAETEAGFTQADAKTANKHAKRVAALFKKLRSLGDPGRDALARLFTHPRVDVRVSAAAYLLRYRTAEAKAVLEEAARGKGFIPFEAQQALLRWQEGTWALDPVDE